MQATNWAADILQLVKDVGVTWPPNVALTQHEKNSAYVQTKFDNFFRL